MRRESVPIESLPLWVHLNDVSLSGVEFRRLKDDDGTDKGCAVVATAEKDDEHLESGDTHSHPQVLIRVPSDLVLSRESVDNYAKSDRYLREVLEAVGDFGRVCFNVVSRYCGIGVQLIYADSSRGHFGLSPCSNRLLLSRFRQ